MRTYGVYLFILAMLLHCAPGCRRCENGVYARSDVKKNLSYVLNARTNTIEGIMIIPENIAAEEPELVVVTAVPRRLYDKKTVTWGRDVYLYDFVEKISALYDFPIRWGLNLTRR